MSTFHQPSLATLAALLRRATATPVAERRPSRPVAVESSVPSALGRRLERAMGWWTEHRLDLVIGAAVIAIASLAMAAAWWDAASRSDASEQVASMAVSPSR